MIMKRKTYYLAVYGNNQVPFSSLRSMQAYFKAAGNMFDGVIEQVKFYKMVLFEIDKPLNS